MYFNGCGRRLDITEEWLLGSWNRRLARISDLSIRWYHCQMSSFHTIVPQKPSSGPQTFGTTILSAWIRASPALKKRFSLEIGRAKGKGETMVRTIRTTISFWSKEYILLLIQTSRNHLLYE